MSILLRLSSGVGFPENTADSDRQCATHLKAMVRERGATLADAKEEDTLYSYMRFFKQKIERDGTADIKYVDCPSCKIKLPHMVPTNDQKWATMCECPVCGTTMFKRATRRSVKLEIIDVDTNPA